jgi:hypothetical protein
MRAAVSSVVVALGRPDCNRNFPAVATRKFAATLLFRRGCQQARWCLCNSPSLADSSTRRTSQIRVYNEITRSFQDDFVSEEIGLAP